LSSAAVDSRSCTRSKEDALDDLRTNAICRGVAEMFVHFHACDFRIAFLKSGEYREMLRMITR
jgi:hypothetical protein